MSAFCQSYADRLSSVLAATDWSPVEQLAEECRRLIREGKQLYICGNGGSAGNAMHLANDYLYGVSPKQAKALRVEALSANSAVLTCLGNDLGYAEIFARQLEVKGNSGDVLLVLSGSGNSPNILRALEVAKAKGMVSYALLGYSGGKAKAMADVAIHFPLDDMQIAEDLQLIVGHMLMRLLNDEGMAC
ncbi:SIS domain-containing protein [Balneatrix alpica]|uniref:SIS domain-containing protein n=1 Tax=Balneatrix alpica TaxID=75684 RepID=A0ABV5ZG93_9GAMM|nr:SIS domain-containing protein [Balneatrix alpica]